MNKLTTVEASFLSGMNEHLKPGTDKQSVINLLRIVQTNAMERGKALGRSGYLGDVTWSDDDLLKGLKH